MPDITSTVTTTTTTPVVSAVKPGIKTTEFALTIIANIFTIFLAFKGMLPANVAAIVIAAINSVYGLGRSLVKIYDPLYNVPDLPPVA